MPDPRPGHFARFLDLTRMERRIVVLMAHDLRGRDICERLELTANCLKTHTYNARRRNLAATNVGLVARLMAENEGRLPTKPAPRSEWLSR